MKKDNYYIYHQSYLTPLLKGLRDSGVSMDRLTSGSTFKKYDYTNPEAYLPMKVVHDFFQSVRKDQDINNLATTFYAHFEISELGEYGEFLSVCPDLLTVLLEGIKYNHLLQTNSVLNLEVTGATSRFTNIHLEAGHEGRRIAERIEIAMILNAFRMVLGEDWIPLKIEIPDSTSEWLSEMWPLQNTKIQSRSPYFAMVFKTDLLSAKNKCKTIQTLPPADNSLDNISDYINLLIRSTQDGSVPSLNDFSTYFDVSERTIIRKLQSEGIRFSSLLERYKFNKSLELLSYHQISINEISQILGYSNAPNFIRAFKKWTNCSPNAYRSDSIKKSSL